jgi:hypothetical protein
MSLHQTKVGQGKGAGNAEQADDCKGKRNFNPR